MNDFDFIDPRFRQFIMGNAPVEQLATGMRWAEGPVWIGDAGCLLFSDIPNNRIMRWIDGVGLGVYRQPSNYANGNTRDREGRLITCEHGTRRVTRTEHDGSITVIADQYQGKRLNSPNDVVVKSDSTIWFTDPHYGIKIDYEGFKSEQEIPCHVYRFDPQSGALDAVIADFVCPNGLCFSPDERRLYVAETNLMFEPDADRHIRVFDIGDDGRKITGGEVFHEVDAGCADGFRADEDGNIWTSAGDGVHAVSPEGDLLGKICIPEVVANVTFGGRPGARNRLFICGTSSIYSVFLNCRGAQIP
ncbi:MAG: SMP-30/gluconolactonase/LRE family protein [Geminicoccaceae bacterium]